jgi:putative colanic acid biosynthesis acetyltransferase WcaF
LDIAANRRAQKYSWREQLQRMLWGVGQWVFRLSPRPCFGWRRFVLRAFGAKIGAQVNAYPSTRIYFPWNLSVGDWTALGEEAFIYNVGPIRIGEKVTISHRAHVCAGTHDYTQADLPLVKATIEIRDQAWVCADAFIGPGVVIGEGAVIGARAVVTSDVPPWTVVAGNPAHAIKRREMRCSQIQPL